MPTRINLLNKNQSVISSFIMAAAIGLATSGCATQSPQSEILVSPLGVPSNAYTGYTGGNNSYQTNTYTGGPLVSNSADVIKAATNLPAIIYFDFDSSAIKHDSKRVLNAHIKLLETFPNARVLVAGHTDERGSKEYNLALGERRAQTVRQYLTAQGVSNPRVEIISYGEEHPVVSGNNETSYQQNRRAELSYQ